MHPHRRLMYGLAGLALVPVGVAGVVVPLLPGIPILAVAAACLAVATHAGVAAGSGLGTLDRIKVEVLIGLRSVLEKAERMTRRRTPPSR